MDTLKSEAELACQQHLDRYCAKHGGTVSRERALKALQFVVADRKKLSGAPAGWAAGIIYALANRGCYPCGVPELLNSDFEAFFGVSMSTIRKRAAQVAQSLDV